MHNVNNWGSFKHFIFASLLCFSVLLFNACSLNTMEESSYLDLFSNLEWTYASDTDTVEDVQNYPENYRFQKFQGDKIRGTDNLSRLVGSDGTYIWLKSDFILTDELKNQTLGFYETRINMAVQVFLNGYFVGKAGRFPPNELGAEKLPHFYTLSESFFNQEGENTLLLKIWVHGKCNLGKSFYVGKYDVVRNHYELSYYFLVSLYTVFEGAFLVLFFLYFILFLGQRKRKAYMIFSLLNLFSALFSLMFFMPLFPLYQNTPATYLYSCKFYGCFCLYCMFYFFTSFIYRYLEIPQKKFILICRLFILVLQSVITFTLPTLNQLQHHINILLSLGLIQLIPALYSALKCFRMRKSDSEKFVKVHVITFGVVPFLACGVADIVIKYGFNNIDIPYLTYYGWVSTMISYLIVLSVQYSRTLKNNEYLNVNLKKEVETQTQELRLINERLEGEVVRNNADMEMAAIVQRRTFENPATNFIGWDFAVCYEPLSAVSGDMYDFYRVGHVLNGFSLFDVSGHGIAASLVTMLSKNIIFRSFIKGFRAGQKTSEIMVHLNDAIIQAKGEADNYMTGLMFQMGTPDENDDITIDFANGGHPHPILYEFEKNEIHDLYSANAVNQYGAIGIKDIPVSFQDVSFKMSPEDILVCYTDGISESLNEQREQFGKKNLMRIIKANHEKTAQGILDAIMYGYKSYIGRMPREDDITIIVLKRQRSEDFIEEI